MLKLSLIFLFPQYISSATETSFDTDDDSIETGNVVLLPLDITSGWLWVPLAIAAAVFVLWVIPYDPMTDFEWQITPTGFRAISVLWLLAVIWFIVSGMFWWMAERETDPLKARVFARSLYCRQMNRELDGIEKRRAARLAKQAKENS